MAKAKNDTSNVQDGSVAGRILMTVPIDSVIPDPERPNIRGKVLDTTDLQPSIRDHGILQPILVRESPDDPLLYYRISGERRQVAARAVGLKTIPVIVGEDLEERDIRRIMLASDLHKREPHIVLDIDGNVIAGKCKAIYEELSDDETTVTRQDLADALGVSSDIVGAYFILHTDIPEIQKKVAKGQMAITVYSLVKHHGPELKLYLAAKKGKVSANYVRATLKEWDERIEPKLREAEADNDHPPLTLDEAAELVESVLVSAGGKLPDTAKVRVGGETVSVKLKTKTTVTQLLTGAFDSLNKIALHRGRLSPTDWAVVEQIESAIGAIRNAE